MMFYPKISKNIQGFTLIELVLAIVILGILAAVTLPRIANLKNDAEFAMLQKVEASLKSASALVYAKSVINGTENLTSSSITLEDGTVILTRYGYPTEYSIMDALDQDLIGSWGGNKLLRVSYGGGITNINIHNNCKIFFIPAKSISEPAYVYAPYQKETCF